MKIMATLHLAWGVITGRFQIGIFDAVQCQQTPPMFGNLLYRDTHGKDGRWIVCITTREDVPGSFPLGTPDRMSYRQLTDNLGRYYFTPSFDRDHEAALTNFLRLIGLVDDPQHAAMVAKLITADEIKLAQAKMFLWGDFDD